MPVEIDILKCRDCGFESFVDESPCPLPKCSGTLRNRDLADLRVAAWGTGLHLSECVKCKAPVLVGEIDGKKCPGICIICYEGRVDCVTVAMERGEA